MSVNLCSRIHKASPDGRLSLHDAAAIASESGLSHAEVEEAALLEGIWPVRYYRHAKTMSPADQIKLLRAKVTVAGCGGLGGHAAALLARLGIGKLILIDPDIFEESNLNRQLFCTVDTLGSYKTRVTASAISNISPALTARAVTRPLEEAASCFKKADAVLDCLDSSESRLHLTEICEKEGIPLVHGAVSTLYGQAAVDMPGHTGLISHIFKPHAAGNNVTIHDGALSFSVAAVAAVQCAETWKIILNRPSPLNGNWIFLDLGECEFEISLRD